jgi:hypothetical protein
LRQPVGEPFNQPRPLDPWPRAGAGRFHRVIALLLVYLGTLILLVELAHHTEQALLNSQRPGRTRAR